jgi:hypothetical protein
MKDAFGRKIDLDDQVIYSVGGSAGYVGNERSELTNIVKPLW